MKVTEIQVLQRAIKDAMKGGLSKLDLLALLPPGHTDQHIMVMLYDHRFCKALFGDDMVVFEYTFNGYPVHKPRWMGQLCLMALSGDPLAYIAQTKYGIEVEQ